MADDAADSVNPTDLDITGALFESILEDEALLSDLAPRIGLGAEDLRGWLEEKMQEGFDFGDEDGDEDGDDGYDEGEEG